jgi:hypothetical protein
MGSLAVFARVGPLHKCILVELLRDPVGVQMYVWSAQQRLQVYRYTQWLSAQHSAGVFWLQGTKIVA